MPVLDTNLLIRVARGDAVAEKALDALADERLVVPMQVAIEYLSGVADPVAELVALHASFTVLHTTDAVLLEAAALRARTRDRVRPRWGDILVAAYAVLDDTYVVTTNKRHYTQLGVDAWNYEKEGRPTA